MSATLVQSEFTFRSGEDSSSFYYFTIVVGLEGEYAVRNITAPTGLIQDSMTELPKTVVDDIAAAYGTVEAFLASTAAVSGSVTFSSEASKSVVFPTALSTSDYSVFVDSGDFTLFKVTSKSTTGFTITASTTYTGTVRYGVFL